MGASRPVVTRRVPFVSPRHMARRWGTGNRDSQNPVVASRPARWLPSKLLYLPGSYLQCRNAKQLTGLVRVGRLAGLLTGMACHRDKFQVSLGDYIILTGILITQGYRIAWSRNTNTTALNVTFEGPGQLLSKHEAVRKKSSSKAYLLRNSPASSVFPTKSERNVSFFNSMSGQLPPD